MQAENTDQSDHRLGPDDFFLVVRLWDNNLTGQTRETRLQATAARSNIQDDCDDIMALAEVRITLTSVCPLCRHTCNNTTESPPDNNRERVPHGVSERQRKPICQNTEIPGHYNIHRCCLPTNTGENMGRAYGVSELQGYPVCQNTEVPGDFCRGCYHHYMCTTAYGVSLVQGRPIRQNTENCMDTMAFSVTIIPTQTLLMKTQSQQN
ncbi:Hypp3110 [Branchiostoma lanceolatum]|uniref:Hypp3110 protein n=1 Tax=Branchiostoma lanceolatum TaxID=7740 RepID=A0A8K0A1P7_BRALA|nr:Hypp3110 [Branchiostoma lanceolatum]